MARSPCLTACPASASASGSCASATGSTTSCTGASQAGNAPPWVSMRWATARSALPMMLRCTITGWCLAPSAPTYERPNRSGR